MSPAVSSAKPALRHRYPRLSISVIRRSPLTTSRANESAGNSAASASAEAASASLTPSPSTLGRLRCRTFMVAPAPATATAATAAPPSSPAIMVNSTSTSCSDAGLASPPLTRPSRNPSVPCVALQPCVASTSRNAAHDREPTSSVLYDSIMTDTCIMSQLDLSAGTRAEARCSSAGSASVAPATMASAVGADSAPGTALLLKPSRSVTTRCTAVMPHARNSRLSYMLLSGKCPDSTQRAVSSDASATLPPSISPCSTLPARFSSVKNALVQYTLVALRRVPKLILPSTASAPLSVSIAAPAISFISLGLATAEGATRCARPSRRARPTPRDEQSSCALPRNAEQRAPDVDAAAAAPEEEGARLADVTRSAARGRVSTDPRPAAADATTRPRAPG
mmetsp:Transcript_32568/g.80289  ORF Transcript_32568/g.80289 Transcript_32568/m.80289 type:complete len:395 (+) Transcript_32568:1194-2378(+)